MTESIQGKSGEFVSKSPEVSTMLPEGISAVVWNSYKDSKVFIIKIGEPIVHLDTQTLEADLQKRANDWMCVPSHPHATPTHWIGFKPLDEYRAVKVEYGMGERGRIKLSLVRSVIDREVFRTESVDEALFRNNGFNLEIENDNDEEGTILNPVLSQLLYDFQTGQGQFAPELEY